MQTRSAENNIAGVTILCGDPDAARKAAPMRPFDGRVCAFLADVSSILMKNPACRTYPDVVTFGFFCRKANLASLKKGYDWRSENAVGKGTVFHIAPSNVPINFAYSLVAGLLAGNANIVKASSKDFLQVRLVAKAFAEILSRDEYEFLRPYVNVIMYDRERQDLTEHFSASCNARVIWGGDATIASVRKAPIPPRAVDICFADRYSLAVIKATAILEIREDERALKALAQDFYNDTYLYDQNACSSPRMIYWLGTEEEAEAAKAVFWQAVYDNIKDRYTLEAESAVDKRMATCRTAIAIEGSRVESNPWDMADSSRARGDVISDNRITRVNIPRLDASLTNLRGNCGFWQEYTDASLEPLAEIVDEKYQTLAYYGCDADSLQQFVRESELRGIDRIVPIGHTADFSLVWDGYDLISELSRKIVVV